MTQSPRNLNQILNRFDPPYIIRKKRRAPQGVVFLKLFEELLLLGHRDKPEWTNSETQRLLVLYKSMGAHWAAIAKHLPGRSENDIKNRFYTTLKRVATQAQLEDPVKYGSKFVKCKKNLLQFVDAAMMYNDVFSSKRGRKTNLDRLKARKEGFLFPKIFPSPPPPVSQPVAQPMNPSFVPVTRIYSIPPSIQYAAVPVIPFMPFISMAPCYPPPFALPQPSPPPYPNVNSASLDLREEKKL